MIVKLRKLFYSLSIILVVASVLSLVFNGLNLGIDFNGGSLLEVRGEVDESKLPSDLTFSLQSSDSGTILRFEEVNEDKHQEIIEALGNEELRFEVVGPTIGNELKSKAIWALVWVLILIILYVAWAFRKVKGSFRYGFLAIVALLHDVLIVLGIFSFFQIEINVAFIVAVLTILGYSVNDTIVVFDRIRENLLKESGELEEVVEMSVKQTIKRSLFTSATTLLVLLSIYFLGGSTVKDQTQNTSHNQNNR